MNNDEKEIDLGFFCMADATAVSVMKEITEAQEFALNKINSFVEAHPAVKVGNVTKAKRMIAEATTINKLTMYIGSLVLAHTSEGLKVIK